ncbi:MAG: ABC transporter permease [Chiayiivirga sp.]|jgi:putative ABC transport system permease protein|uniref:ABC transporter permease n=1 Tax=Chiayiivirga sp. TaxID=2041042 RepID=UPI0025B7BBA2|nr:ABC transporter permease [Chiayiivirga sp.]MCI1728168.1 ABC transporter permease [Chiayiivirga sp.]
MKYFHLIWAALMRSKTRTLLTMLSVVTAFLLFGMLDSVRVAFNSSANVTGYNRLITASRLSFTQVLPYSVFPQAQTVPGIKSVTYANWFGGLYQGEQRNFFPNFAVGPGFFEMYPEYILPPEQLKAFYAERTGAVVGKGLADRHGWKIGDTIPLQATIFPTKGSNNWEFKLVGIYDMADEKREGEENQLVFNWQYFDEANDYIKNQIGWLTVELAEGADANAVARAIDALSENSDHETKTQTEQAFNQGFFKMFADIGLIVTAIMGAVFFTLLLLTGNTMAQAVRERIPELAVLKTIGFSDATVLVLVLAESVLLIVLAGCLGLAIAQVLMPGISKGSGGVIQLPGVPPETWALGLALMLAIGIAIGLLPALRGMRLKIVDALAGR